MQYDERYDDQNEVGNEDTTRHMQPEEDTAEPAPVSGFASKFAANAYGEDVDEGISSSLNFLIINQLAEKPLRGVLDKYEMPTKTKTLCVPRVNLQIWDSLRAQQWNTDPKLQKVE